MRNTATAPVLETLHGETVILEKVEVDARIDDLVAEVSVSQHYRNPEQVDIEAVYSFPLPPEATLLDFRVEIGDRVLAGTVVGRMVAERTYDEAITDGDTAIMLEHAANGICTANVGNLKPGETLVIRFCYGQFLRWNGDLVRLMMPTTIAPKYGDPHAGVAEPHQALVHSFDAERSFSLQVTIDGILAGGKLTSPSHQIEISKEGDAKIVRTAGTSPMDRDFVLEMRTEVADGSAALMDRDTDGHVVVASFRPTIPGLEARRERLIKIVVDCSGSMSGDSIQQARIAIERILDGLRAGDHFNITAFGSRYTMLFDRAAEIGERSLEAARRFVHDLDASMGGTEIGSALSASYGSSWRKKLPADMLLITDGGVSNTAPVIKAARRSGHRIFTVGVGSAVSETFVRELAETTGGACELVSPREDMAERIHRHFQRIYAPEARAEVIWPGRPEMIWPQTIDTVFDGDTLHAFGWFKETLEGEVAMELKLDDGRRLVHHATIRQVQPGNSIIEDREHDLRPLARMAAAVRLGHLGDDRDAEALAVRYQLMSRWSNYLVIHVRAEEDKAGDSPEQRTIPQVIAAGWHGTGSVLRDTMFERISSAPSVTMQPMAHQVELMHDEPIWRQAHTIQAREADHDLLSMMISGGDWRSLEVLDLERLAVPLPIIEVLQQLTQAGAAERAVVLALLDLVAQSEEGQAIDRLVRRGILAALKSANPPAYVVPKIRAAIETANWIKLRAAVPAPEG